MQSRQAKANVSKHALGAQGPGADMLGLWLPRASEAVAAMYDVTDRLFVYIRTFAHQPTLAILFTFGGPVIEQQLSHGVDIAAVCETNDSA